MPTRSVTEPLAWLLGLLSIGILTGCGGDEDNSSSFQVVGTQQTEIEPNSIVLSDMLVSVLGRTERLSDVTCTSDLSVCGVIFSGFQQLIPIDGSGDSGSPVTAYTSLETWEYMSVSTIHAELDGVDMKFGLVGGVNYEGSQPAEGSASWSGEMVALDAGNKLVRGEATLEITDLQTPKVDVTLSPEDYPEMTWNGIPLADGKFSYERPGSDSDYIKGELYGPEVQETGGVFERNRLVGAFGAKQVEAKGEGDDEGSTE